MVTPEYNHSFPASLKQAIDFAYDEWQAKPVGFVAYGCRSAGRHAMTVRDVAARVVGPGVARRPCGTPLRVVNATKEGTDDE